MRAGKATPMQIDLETGEILEDGSEEELAEWVQLYRATRDRWTVNIRLPHLKKLAGYHRVSSASGVMRQYAPATLEAVSAPSDTRSSPLTLLGAAGESHGAICLHVGKATRRLRP